MSGIQVNGSLCPKVYLTPTNHLHRQRPLCLGNVSFPRSSPRVRISYKVEYQGHKRLSPVCLSRAERGSGSGEQDPLWKSFGNALENLGKKSSVEDLLKQQIENQEYYKDDGPGGKPPGRGGGGGGGGGFGDFEEEDFSGVLDETIQVILATLGFIFLYVYIISGAEIARLGKDYIKYLFGGQRSIRLARVILQWETFFKHLKNLGQREETDKFWLEKAIINTPTWWDHPEKYRQIIRNYLQTQSRSDDDD